MSAHISTARAGSRGRRTKLVVAAVGGAAALLLAGCGGSSTGAEEAPTADVDLEALSVTEQTTASEPGPYAVGRRTITVTDPSRADRSFEADIWYPVDPNNTGGAAAADYAFLPGLGYTSDVSLADAPPAEGEFPLVLYSHGGGGFRWVATFYTEQLASQGYVVVAPDHPGSTALDQLSGAAVSREDNANVRPGDVTATLDAVLATSANTADPLAGRVDSSKIAVSGHSWGGYTSIASVAGHTNSVGTTTPDERIKGLILMAPYTEMLADEELSQVDVPVLVVSSTRDESTPIAENTDRPADLIPGRPLIRVDIDGGSHNSFTDVCKLRDAVAGNPDIPAAVTERLAEGSEETCAPGAFSAECGMTFAHRGEVTQAGGGSDSLGLNLRFHGAAVTINGGRDGTNRQRGSIRRWAAKAHCEVRGHGAGRPVQTAVQHECAGRGPVAVAVQQRSHDAPTDHPFKGLVVFLRHPGGNDRIADTTTDWSPALDL